MDNEGLALILSLIVGLAVFTTTHVHAWDTLHHPGRDANPPETTINTAAVRNAGPH